LVFTANYSEGDDETTLYLTQENLDAVLEKTGPEEVERILKQESPVGAKE